MALLLHHLPNREEYIAEMKRTSGNDFVEALLSIMSIKDKVKSPSKSVKKVGEKKPVKRNKISR